MADGGDGLSRADHVAHEIDHRVAHAHPIRRVAAGDDDRVELSGARFPRRQRRRDLAAATAGIGGARNRSDEHHLEPGRANRVGGAVHRDVFELLLDEDGDTLSRLTAAVAHAVWECIPNEGRQANRSGPSRACPLITRMLAEAGHRPSADNGLMPNRLAHEKSPYLLQHAENPVDWYPWGDEAFAAARAADKPIFLSVKAEEMFRFADHVGGVVHNTDDKSLHGVSWGSRRFYRWTLDASGKPTNASEAPEKLRTLNTSHYLDYQDCKYAGKSRMLCSGVTEMRVTPEAPPFRLGGVDLVDLADGRPIFQMPVLLWTEGGMDMTHNPVWMEASERECAATSCPRTTSHSLHLRGRGEVERGRGGWQPVSCPLPA